MVIRDAETTDLAGITAIYNDAVAHTTAIWNDAVVDVANRAAWLAERRRAGFPVLVARGPNGQVLGYASFAPWRAWDGYRHTVENSVYVAAEGRGRGVGRALMVQLIDRAQAMGKHVMVAGIEAGNRASIGLHESLGFAPAGLFRQVGTKFGRWLDLACYQRMLNPPSAPAGSREG